MKVTGELRRDVRRYVDIYLNHPTCRLTPGDLAKRARVRGRVFKLWLGGRKAGVTEDDEQKIIRWAWYKFPGLQKKHPGLFAGPKKRTRKLSLVWPTIKEPPTAGPLSNFMSWFFKD